MKWVPFIDVKNGKLKWKVNKHSAKYDNMNKLLNHRKDNPSHDISIGVFQMKDRETIDYYNTIGTIIYLKKTHFVNRYQMIVYRSTRYFEFIDNYGFKNSFFCSMGLLSLCKKDYDVYQDGLIHSILCNMECYEESYENYNNTYRICIEKY
jgi:hypothetical protein